jgi:hypothetical protein
MDMKRKNHNTVTVGDIVDLARADDKTLYSTKIVDIYDSGLLVAGVPNSGGLEMTVYRNDELQLTFYRETGKFTVHVSVVDFSGNFGLRQMTLRQISEPVRHQMRTRFRLPVSINVALCEYWGDFEDNLPDSAQITDAEIIVLETVSTKDISITGISVLTKNEYELGKKLILALYLGDMAGADENPLLICAEVKRVNLNQRSKTYRLGLNFFDQTKNMGKRLSTYLVEQERKMLRKMLLQK